MKNIFIWSLVTFLFDVACSQTASFNLGLDSTGAPVIVQTTLNRVYHDGSWVEARGQNIERFQNFGEALAAVRLLKQKMVDDSIRIQQTVLENNLSIKQIETILSELKRLNESPPIGAGGFIQSATNTKRKKPGD